MAYTKPSALVYQELLNAGGGASISPDLPACIIGTANNTVNIDLSDPLQSAKSVGSVDLLVDEDDKTNFVDAVLYTLNDPNYDEGDENWNIHVNVNSAFAGQDIDDASIKVELRNPLVLTYKESFSAITGNDITPFTNQIGTAEMNNFDATLPWVPGVKHVNVGDTVIAQADGGNRIVTFVTEVKDTTFVLADALASDNYDIEVYHKFSTSIPQNIDWDTSTKQVVFGSLGANTIAFDATNDYTYAVECEVRGYGSPLEVHIGYIAARSDLSSTITQISDTTDLENKLGIGHPVDNPLAFGVGIALANSGGAPVFAIGTDPDLSELSGHVKATELAEGQDMYWMTPLTEDPSVQAVYKNHVGSMSTPASAKWRVALFNNAVPTDIFILGRPDGGDLDEDGFMDNLIPATVSPASVMVDSGVGTTAPGDTLYVYNALTPEAEPTQHVINDASGSIIAVEGATPIGFSGQAFVYVAKSIMNDRNAQAKAIAAQSSTWMDKRVLNFPGEVMVDVDGVSTAAPGYYLMCAVAGFGSGVPAQQGLTNITFAGIQDLLHANFYFTEDQLNLMAGDGTFLAVQEAQGTTPYCRHGLTTDVSVLEYREILKVKNWDYLSYYFNSLIDPFIGTWNITQDTIQTIRQTVAAGSEALMGRRLPKIGAPLLSYNIAKLEQNEFNSDALDVEIGISIVDPNNYTNIYLQI